MNTRDFGFCLRLKEADTPSREAPRNNDLGKREAPLRAPTASQFKINDGDRFMHIVEQTSQINCHLELFQLLQSDDIQRFIPHEILISAWGDFDRSDLTLDVVSAIPGVRTGLINQCSIGSMLDNLHKRWLVNRRQPLLLDSSMNVGQNSSECACVLHNFLQGDWSLLVHGVTDLRDGNVSLYLAFNPSSIVNGHGIQHFRLLADHLITQIDVAFRRVAALKVPGSTDPEINLARALSAREEQILLSVSEGKTNTEISQLLAISAFTVKNHLQRIMKKLNAGNRTEAVAKYRRTLRPQNKNTMSEHGHMAQF